MCVCACMHASSAHLWRNSLLPRRRRFVLIASAVRDQPEDVERLLHPLQLIQHQPLSFVDAERWDVWTLDKEIFHDPVAHVGGSTRGVTVRHGKDAIVGMIVGMGDEWWLGSCISVGKQICSEKTYGKKLKSANRGGGGVGG